MKEYKRKAAGAGEHQAACKTNYGFIVSDNGAIGKIPVEGAQIASLIGHFQDQVGNPSSRAFAIYAKPVNLLNEPCTCSGNGVCPACRAWQSTMRLNEERRLTK